MPSKRQVLGLLTRPELQDIADRYQLDVADRRVRDDLIEAAAAGRKVSLGEVLADYARDRLKELCRSLDLDDSGKEKAPLVERLVGKKEKTPVERPAPASPTVEAPRLVEKGTPLMRLQSNGPTLAPVAGALAEVRQRQYLIEDVIKPEGPEQLTRVRLVCLDDDASGRKLDVLWERELGARVYAPEGIEPVDHIDPPRRFAAYLHALQWNTVTASDPRVFQAPFRAGIKRENHQLVPLKKALELPRVNLFIADDVGVGKTIEAGLVMRELLLRQRVDKILIVCPAALTLQWRAELERRFGLRFDIFTRQLVARRRQERGFGINVWTTYPRFIVSYQMLRRPEHFDSLKVFLGRPDETNLLVLDEAHHAAPASDSKLYAIDSDTTDRIREIAPLFEHRLFLSATPHNGHSNSFSALLEMLDPQRFTRGVPASGPKALEPVMVRRLKRDLRQLGAGEYPERRLVQLDLTHEDGHWFESASQGGERVDLGAGRDTELALSKMLAEYSELVDVRGRGRLVLINLQKRLLSSVAAFARTLLVHARSVGLEHLGDALDEDDDDSEEDVEAYGESDAQIDAADVEEVRTGTESVIVPPGRARDLLGEMLQLARARANEPGPKALALLSWIRRNMCHGDEWTDRRVIVFTEYADTKRHLRLLLQGAFEDTDQGTDRIVELHGGMSDARREEVQVAFNAPPDEHPARILLATDTAREGVNLQGYCADLFHFDIPWNPARMEQRNGRIDRALQPSKEVRCHYFFLPERKEDHVLRTLVSKVATIQSELGSLGQVVLGRVGDAMKEGIGAQTLARLELAQELSEKRRRASSLVEERTLKRIEAEIEDAGQILDRSRRLLSGFSPQMLREVVDVAIEDATGRPLKPTRVNARDAHELPEMDEIWQRTLDSLRPPRPRDEPIHEWRRRPPKPIVFEPLDRMTEDVEQLHLEHPLVQRLLTRLRALGVARRDLSRVTIVRDPERATARVIAFGRLSLFGPGASRLHDEVIPVAARWAEASAATHLKPFSESADREAIADLEQLFARSPSLEVNETVAERLRKAAPGDFAALWPYVGAEADRREGEVREKLAARGQAEGESLKQILRDQRALIQRTLESREEAQLELDFDPREREQRERDLVHMRRRLEQIDHEIVVEPKRLAAAYEVTLRRLEPIGLVYLWPGTR
jgi:hypothetical protein